MYNVTNTFFLSSTIDFVLVKVTNLEHLNTSIFSKYGENIYIQNVYI